MNLPGTHRRAAHGVSFFSPPPREFGRGAFTGWEEWPALPCPYGPRAELFLASISLTVSG